MGRLLRGWRAVIEKREGSVRRGGGKGREREERRSTHSRHEVFLPVGRRRTSERREVTTDPLLSLEGVVDSTVVVGSVDVGFERLSEELTVGRRRGLREVIGRELLSSVSPHSIGSSV